MTRSSRTLALSVAAAVVAWSAVACSSAGGGPETRDAAGVQRFLDRYDAALRTGRFTDFYALLSPRFRSLCAREDFLPPDVNDPDKRDFNWSHTGRRDLHIEVSGNTARVTYVFTYDGEDSRTITEDDPDIYTYVDGHWYDDLKGSTDCHGD